MFRQIYSIFRIAFIVLQNIVFIPSYLFTTHVVLYPIYLCDSRTYWKIENHLYNFLLYVVSSWSWCAGIVGKCDFCDLIGLLIELFATVTIPNCCQIITEPSFSF